jgi:hypothetical protein
MPKKSMRSRSQRRRGGSWTDPSSWSLSNPFASEEEQPTNYGMGMGTGTGGRRGKRRRSMRGGDYSANTPMTGLASTSASVSDVPTATAQLVGGRTRRRRRHRHGKSCRKR